MSFTIPNLSRRRASGSMHDGSISICNVNRLAIFVSGPMAGQTLGFACGSSYDSYRVDPPLVPFVTRKITGATLTKAGR